MRTEFNFIVSSIGSLLTKKAICTIMNSVFILTSSRSKAGPCLQTSREYRRHCGGVPKIQYTLDAPDRVAAPPPGFALR